MTIQPELPLDWPVPAESYTVEIRRGPQFAEAEVLRSHTVKSPEDAYGMVEGLRDTYNQRHDVSWQTEEPNADGQMYGLGPGGEVYVIAVSPPLG
jgi:hypothetical protein